MDLWAASSGPAPEALHSNQLKMRRNTQHVAVRLLITFSLSSGNGSAVTENHNVSQLCLDLCIDPRDEYDEYEYEMLAGQTCKYFI